MRKEKMHVVIAMVLLTLGTSAAAGELADIILPVPRTDGGKPLMQALKDRQTSRVFSPKKLPAQTVADLLWAAFGINRPDAGKRTAPSARNWQEIEIYVVMEEGIYLYDAKDNKLKIVAKGDFRKATGGQKFVASAPVNLVYVADEAKMNGAAPSEIGLYSGADAGFISQNVYLFCASEGLATVVRGMVNRDALGKILKLSAQKKVVLAQTVGYPGENEKSEK